MADKKLIRNYCSDTPAMMRDIYIALCKGFDEMQDDSFVGVDKGKMIGFIMKETRGSVNPMVLNEILKDFEK